MNQKEIITSVKAREEILDKIFSYLCGIGINSVNRFEKFLQIKESLSDKEYWVALSFAYTSTDYLGRYYNEINEAFLSNRPYREYLMSEEETLFLNSLPEGITIYRGMFVKDHQVNHFGVSWTLSRKVAEFFATINGRTHNPNKDKRKVYKKIINKSEVIAYFKERNEYEIIYVEKPVNLIP